jgi:hypothetical protein
MTLTALTQFISKGRKGEIYQVERDGQGGASVYFYCKDKTPRKNRYFTIHCTEAEKIRVYPESFSKLSIRADRISDGSRTTARRRKIVSFDDMYIVGYGFESIHVPIG